MWPEVKKAYDVLQRGGIILYPTDTIWGLGCDALNAKAVDDIYRLKHRDEAKSLIILLAEAKDIFQYVANPHPDIISILKSFKRPTTVIYPLAVGLPENLVNDDGSIAIRITGDPFCKALLKKLKKPLVSTSANQSGSPSPQSFQLIDDKIKSGVDHIVNYRQDESSNGPSSRIIRISADGSFTTIRD